VITVEELISRLSLQALPREGGFFRETYRAKGAVPAEILGGQYTGPRNFGTAIYYLLTPQTFSAMHLLPGEEIFHFYLGDPVEMLQLRQDGTGELIVIGAELDRGMRPQVLVPGGVWQGSRMLPGGRVALLGTTMAPGFDPADYIHGDRETLAVRYPEFAEIITNLTTGA
jgi:uncharacterized protein